MSDPVFRFCDDLGPKTIQYIYNPETGLKAIVVVDNVAAGPAIGGARMAPDVSLEECFRLARAMTFKNAAAGLAHGGGKSVIFADPRIEAPKKQALVRAFANAIGPLTDYIVGPDMGTNETAMAWVYDEIGRCVGLPAELGGIPLDEIGATGFGLVVSTEVAAAHESRSLEGARIAMQGFGAVGKHAARFFAGKGAILVAAADSSATVRDPSGLDVEALIGHKERGASIRDYPSGEIGGNEAVIAADCDILVPAARPDALRADNQAEVRAWLVAPGANIGVTEEAEALLHSRGVLCIPDFISNAGGVICGSVEIRGGTEQQAFEAIESRIRINTTAVLTRSKQERTLPRQAAVEMAEERIRHAMKLRRWG